MLNFDKLIIDVMDEKGLSLKDLIENKIVTEKAFYKYRYQVPDIPHVIAISNFLEVSLDYLLGNIDVYKFRRYKTQQINIYNNINNILSSLNISKYKLCKDTGLTYRNFARWKNGSIPKFSTIIEISKYLNCRIDDILDRESI